MLGKTGFAALTLSLVVLCAVAHARDHSLILTVGKYAGGAAPDVIGSSQDRTNAAAIARALHGKDAPIELHADSELTLDGLRRLLAQFVGQAEQGDRLLLYFSGLGVPDEGGDCQPALLSFDLQLLRLSELERNFAVLRDRVARLVIVFDVAEYARQADLVTQSSLLTGPCGNLGAKPSLTRRAINLEPNTVVMYGARNGENAFRTPADGGLASSSLASCLQARDITPQIARRDVSIAALTDCVQHFVDRGLSALKPELAQHPEWVGDTDLIALAPSMPVSPTVTAATGTDSGSVAMVAEVIAARVSAKGPARIAVAIGNSAYAYGPLKNPRNDARAIANVLAEAGFRVELFLDVSEAAMEHAVLDFGHRISEQHAIGLFYFAGHGMQLDWKNYLVPVDARVARIGDVPQKTFDLTRLFEVVRVADNPMTLIILDACRSDPFGDAFHLTRQGLSQMDAPPRTFLAYATSPGATADDGRGDNGLYTAQLLKEMRAPRTQLEDVFKRVRLAVRLTSQGRQIPWESTSLEDNFFFDPTATASTIAAASSFAEERALWEQLAKSNDAQALEDFLRQFPSGSFSELAQFRLDQLLRTSGDNRLKATTSPATPYSKGLLPARFDYSIGDSYEYKIVDRLSGRGTQKAHIVVTAVTNDSVVYNDGDYVTDLLGNVLVRHGKVAPSLQYFVPEYYVGKRWKSHDRFVALDGGVYVADIEYRVVGREQITVAAGTFDAFRVEGEGTQNGNWQRSIVYWVAPDQVRRVIAIEQTVLNRTLLMFDERRELVTFKEK